ncbi:MAG: phage tail assembly chaperone [Rhizobiales bacterium]|nr:phage tail assembly chaperone [Hyphomicrobiales bacterium]
MSGCTRQWGALARTRLFPWDDAMALGLGVLRLSPREFWSMTPIELDAAIRGLEGRFDVAGAPLRADLLALMARYPDN